jgi:hypothetical protein
MSSRSLFISYGHRDMEEVNWLERLKLYLAPLRRQEVVDCWDDGRIKAGTDWRQSIASSMERAAAAVLLVGPGFLASDFIATEELPRLLENGRAGRPLYPLIVGYCAYAGSPLGSYQAFNDPQTPLEALAVPEQNRILNKLSEQVDADLRKTMPPNRPVDASSDKRSAMQTIQTTLAQTHTAFVAQARRRDQLVQSVRSRLAVNDHLQYERFFFKYFERLDRDERFQFDQIRAMTEGPLHDGNQTILRTLERFPELMEEIPSLLALRQHLVFWLNKYDRVFTKTPAMSLLYTGVEDGVPFPKGIDQEVSLWLRDAAR